MRGYSRVSPAIAPQNLPNVGSRPHLPHMGMASSAVLLIWAWRHRPCSSYGRGVLGRAPNIRLRTFLIRAWLRRPHLPNMGTTGEKSTRSFPACGGEGCTSGVPARAAEDRCRPATFGCVRRSHATCGCVRRSHATFGCVVGWVRENRSACESGCEGMVGCGMAVAPVPASLGVPY